MGDRVMTLWDEAGQIKPGRWASLAKGRPVNISVRTRACSTTSPRAMARDMVDRRLRRRED